jgi:hypothetical protein
LPSRPTAETVIRQAPGTAEADASILWVNGILILGHPVGPADIGGALRRAQARTPPAGKVDEVNAIGVDGIGAGKVDNLDELDAIRARCAPLSAGGRSHQGHTEAARSPTGGCGRRAAGGGGAATGQQDGSFSQAERTT